MKSNPISRYIAAGICTVLMLTNMALAGGSSVKSAAEASPDVYKIILENDHVRVLVMDLLPGQIDEWHNHPDETVYFERGGKLKIHLPDGTALAKEVPDGGIMWHEAWVHRVENIGETPVRAIIVESMTGSQ